MLLVALIFLIVRDQLEHKLNNSHHILRCLRYQFIGKVGKNLVVHLLKVEHVQVLELNRDQLFIFDLLINLWVV